jgi:phage portal protein BeeE
MSIRDDDHQAAYAWLRRAEAGDLSVKAQRRRPRTVPFPGGGRNYGMMVFSGDGTGVDRLVGGSGLPGAKADYRSRAGALHKNAVVAACLGWIVDTFGQARLIVAEEDEESGECEPVEGHALPKMLRRPNDFYSVQALWSATVISRKLYGQAYWHKLRNGFNKVIGVRWIPNAYISPMVPTGAVTSEYIAAYEYKIPGAEPVPIPPEDIVHFRDGLSPDDERSGWDRMESVLRDIVTTNQAATFTAALMTNMGIAAVVFTGTDGVPLDDEEADAIEQGWRDSTSGENVGAPFALKHPVNVERVGLSPEELALDILPKRSVSNICSVMRLSPLVLGLEDDRGTYENVDQATKAAWMSCLIPLQDAMAADLTHQLLIPDFGGTETQKVSWDRTKVEALQEGKDAKAQRVSTLTGGKQVIEVNEARAEMGLPEIEGGNDLTTDKVDPVEEQVRLMRAQEGLDDEDEDSDDSDSPAASRNGRAFSVNGAGRDE